MRNRSLSLVVAVAAMLLFVGSASAQGVVLSRDSTWVFSGNLSATFNQVALTNWVAGGENTLGGEAAALLDLKYAKSKQLWQNTLELGYGLMKQGDKGVIKNLDKIDFASQYGYQATQAWYYSALFGVKTQFAAGYKYPDTKNVISDFAAPLYLQLSLGASYKPDNHFSALISPLTARWTFVMNQDLADQGAFGVKAGTFDAAGVRTAPGENLRTELGGYIKLGYTNSFFNNMLGLTTKLELFSNYLENPQNVDVNYDLLLDFKVSSFLTARAQLTLIYDDDQKMPNAAGKPVAVLQVRQMFGLGLAYRF